MYVRVGSLKQISRKVVTVFVAKINTIVVNGVQCRVISTIHRMDMRLYNEID